MPVLLERKRPSERQLKAVRSYIMRRRHRERQALAESKAKQEAAMQRKREQENKKETVEDVKLEITKLESKLESLKSEKHELFLQLKKVLNEESEQKRLKERQLTPAFHHPMMANSVHRMPYGMMGPRPYVVNMNNVPPRPQVRMEVPPNAGGVKQPITPVQGYPYPIASNQPNTSGPQYQHSSSSFMTSNDQTYGQGSNHSLNDKQLKTGNQPIQGSSTSTTTPLHVITSYTLPSGSHQSPHNQSMVQQGDKHQTSVKSHSPKTMTSTPYSYPTQYQEDHGLHQGRPSVNPTVPHQPHQFPYSQSQQITSSSTFHKHDTTNQVKHSSQPQNKQSSTYTAYTTKSEPVQHSVHHNKPPNKPIPTHPKTEQISPHKQPTLAYPSQTENVNQEHSQPIRAQQYGVHNYQQHQGVTSTSQIYPPSHAKQPPQSSTNYSSKPAQTSTNYPSKPTQESDPKQGYQPPSTKPQQTYGYSMQQQSLSYGDHQKYLNKNQPTNQATAQVSYPISAHQQSYPGHTKEQSPQYSQQYQGYPVTQQVYSGQYQGFLSQQYQSQPYHGYPAQTDLKTTTQTYQGTSQSSQKNRPFEQSKHDQDMPPPPPQKPPPKQDQEHYHQSNLKRSSHRYGHPYKRDHHSSSSSKTKFSEKYSSSQDDHSSSSSSRHHYHSSNKSSHSKGSTSSSSSSRQSRYH